MVTGYAELRGYAIRSNGDELFLTVSGGRDHDPNSAAIFKSATEADRILDEINGDKGRLQNHIVAIYDEPVVCRVTWNPLED